MAEYIKKEDVLDEAYWHGGRYTVQNPYPSGVEAVDVEDIEKMETINIVKCKNCIYHIYDEDLCSDCKPESCSTIQEGDDWCEEVYRLLKTPAADVAPYSIEPDGTLTITVPKGIKVGRVLVQEEGTKFGGLFYAD